MISSVLLFLNIGTPELMLIMFVVLLMFGGNKLPELARGLGKGIREFKDASEGVKREIHRNINSVQEDLDTNYTAATTASTATEAPVNPVKDETKITITAPEGIEQHRPDATTNATPSN